MKTRFAPSPTGKLHIGTVRTAVFAYLAAKNGGGQFLLRIEDTDRARLVDGAEDQIKESLKWIGLKWDEEPLRQSDRLDLYKQHAQMLVDKGLAYADPYSKEEVEQFRQQAKDEKRPFLFREHRPGKPPKWDGTQPLRFKVPEIKEYTWHDEVRGELSAGEEALDDFIILKAADDNGDSYPTYNFAHIIDDHDTEITHIIRGEEFIASMPKYLSLYEALEIPTPKFVTVPLILGSEGGKKLSKRDGATSLLEYRDNGFLPSAVLNFLTSLGWNDGTDNEIFNIKQLEKKFSIKRIQRSPARFDSNKLDWFNWQHAQQMINDDLDTFLNFLEESEAYRFHRKYFFSIEKSSKLAASKARSITEFIDQMSIFDVNFKPLKIDDFDLSLVSDELDADHAKTIIAEVIIKMSKTRFTTDVIEEALREYIKEKGYENRVVLNLVRWLLTNKKVSPNLFETITTLGQSETMRRLDLGEG